MILNAYACNEYLHHFRASYTPFVAKKVMKMQQHLMELPHFPSNAESMMGDNSENLDLFQYKDRHLGVGFLSTKMKLLWDGPIYRMDIACWY